MTTTNITYTSPETKEPLVERLYKAGYITFQEALMLANGETKYVQVPVEVPSSPYDKPNGPWWSVEPYLRPWQSGLINGQGSPNLEITAE